MFLSFLSPTILSSSHFMVVPSRSSAPTTAYRMV